jgi:Tol biopolymer transport system component
MQRASVRPGGGWLAYSTNVQVDKPLDGSTPGSAYLLNLSTGERLQLNDRGVQGSVGSWSPDGNWLLTGAGIVSADGRQQIKIPDPGAEIDAVWSPDSRQLAYASLRGHSPDGHIITSWSGEVRVVNLPERTLSNPLQLPSKSANGEPELAWQVRWSPDGALLSLLTFPYGGPDANSVTLQAIYHMSVER